MKKESSLSEKFNWDKIQTMLIKQAVKRLKDKFCLVKDGKNEKIIDKIFGKELVE